jgi:uncharacterized membrane protein YebE (DUF533 family)
MDWKSLPTWAKGTIAIVGVLAIGGVGFAIYKSVKKAVEKAKESKEGREAKDELRDAEKEGIKPTISEAESEAKVSALISAADECDPLGQGATQIIAVIKSLKNKADFYLVSSKFGTKTWDECGWGTGDITGSITTLLTEELDSGQMRQVREHLSSIGVNI